MEMTVPQKLQTYIEAELGDAALYLALAKMAPNDNDRGLLTQLSEEEQTHAETFQHIYKMLTKRYYQPALQPVELTGSYRDILRDRVLDESGDYRKYGEQYLQTNQNSALKSAYYRARTDENVHALRLLYLLSR